MELLHPHCAGLDIHKETVVACVRHLRSGKVTTGIRTFKTTTEELIALSDWLATETVTQTNVIAIHAVRSRPSLALGRFSA